MADSSKSIIETLLRKYVDGKPNLAEKRQLGNLISDSENRELFKEILLKNISEFNEPQFEENEVDFDGIFRNILNEIKQSDQIETDKLMAKGKSKVKRILLYSASLAAVFLIAFSLGNFFPFYKIGNSSEATVKYTFNEIKAPLGSRTEVQLPDGSHVLLNAGSTLRYRSDFNLNHRDLILAGEAYFTVARNTDLPLNVSVGHISIKAVGTEFNVKAYGEEGIIETTLVEGKVVITQTGQSEDESKYLDLKANQKAIYFKESDSFSLENIKNIDTATIKPVNTLYDNILIAPRVDIAQVVAWTQGKLIIRGESLDNLCVELQRKYNVNFIFNNEEIKKYRFSGVLLDETLEQVMTVIKLTAPIDFYLEGKTVFLSSDKEQLDNYSKHLK